MLLKLQLEGTISGINTLLLYSSRFFWNQYFTFLLSFLNFFPEIYVFSTFYIFMPGSLI